MTDIPRVDAPVQNGTTNDSTPFTSLREFEIRVLDLQACHDATDSSIFPVTGRLRIVNLNDKPEFTTLSYTWGERTPSQKILCNGHSVKVPRNCWLALQDIRRQFGAITIWVDSICINQDDQEEKNVQIPLMDQIYTLAHTGYIWLGDGPKNFKTSIPRAMGYLAEGGLPFSFLINHTVDGVPTGHGMAFRLAVHLLLGVNTRNAHNIYADSLQEIIRSVWIERLWTLQEVLLSPNSILVCGNQSIPWLSMVYMLEYFSFLKSKGYIGVFTDLRGLPNWTRLEFLWLRHQRKTSPESANSLESKLKLHRQSLELGWNIYRILSLLTMVILVWTTLFSLTGYAGQFWWTFYVLTSIVPVYHKARNLLAYNRKMGLCPPDRENEALVTEIQTRGCFDPMDKYRGLLGVIGAQSSRVAVDNSMSLGETYQKLFHDVLSFTESLDLLLFTSQSRFNDTPSWVIDWRFVSLGWLKCRYWAKCGWWVATPDWPRSNICQYAGATLASKSSWKFEKNGKLVVRGKPIATLSWCSPNIEMINTPPKSSTHEEMKHNVATFEFAFAGLNFQMQSKVARDLSRFVEFFSDILEGPAWRSWYQIISEGTNTLAKLTTHRQRWPPLFRAWNFHFKLSNILAGEKMILVHCDEASFPLGLAPPNARNGDLVTLISGVSMPVLLRRCTGGYIFVGPMFLPGTMDGEVWKDDCDKGLEELVLM